MHAAARGGHLECCEWLAASHADAARVGGMASVRDADGATPLLVAASRGHARVVAWLLDGAPARSRADAAQTDNDGNDAMTLAKAHAQLDVVAYLRARARSRARTSGFESSLSSARSSNSSRSSSRCDSRASSRSQRSAHDAPASGPSAVTDRAEGAKVEHDRTAASEVLPLGESAAAQRRQRLVDADAARRERKQRARLARQKRGEKAATEAEDVRPEVPPVATCDAPSADPGAIPEAAAASDDLEGELLDVGTAVSKGVRGPLRPLRTGRVHPSEGCVEPEPDANGAVR